MKFHKLSEFKGGWLCGYFDPSLIKTNKFEVAVQSHNKGFIGQKHYHKLSTEYNLIISGKVKLNNQYELTVGDIFIYEPNEVSESEFIEDTTILVIRDFSVSGDKYIV